LRSLCKLTQAPSQSVKPELQAMPQLPFAHDAAPFAGAGQVWSQSPQFWVSVFTLRHSLPQAL